jgi:hypothetical protein
MDDRAQGRDPSGDAGWGERPVLWEQARAHILELREWSFEENLRLFPHAYFGGIVRRVRPLPLEDLEPVLDRAVAGGSLSDEEAEEVWKADLHLVGRSPEDTPVYLVVEAALTIDAAEVHRAARRAALLGRAGVPTLAVVAGARITVDGEQAARDREVWRVLDGRAYPPGTAVGAA